MLSGRQGSACPPDESLQGRHEEPDEHGRDPRGHRGGPSLKLVLDTDVIAAALLGEPDRGEEASRFIARCREPMAPAHWKAELASVVWKAVVLGRLPRDRIGVVLDEASRLPITSVDVSDLWQGAVMRAAGAKHPVYDVLFVELAVRECTVVASYDRDFRRAFPDLVILPSKLPKG
ncbi:MAG: type II toxin-antitoxin system VapC family toxin [Myxococcota bacterium]|nr:type II toxin-antitoxin system VapC family toxin [Myxococcota bacterium]MDI7267277.1 type II toxin-antitoxin system VapC family toxin [Myxococcota bacterium]